MHYPRTDDKSGCLPRRWEKMAARGMTASLAVLAGAGSSGGRLRRRQPERGRGQAKQVTDSSPAAAAGRRSSRPSGRPAAAGGARHAVGGRELNISFIDGPNGDGDIVHTPGGSWQKLEWDLDHDGKVSAEEREITERDLYDATLGLS